MSQIYVPSTGGGGGGGDVTGPGSSTTGDIVIFSNTTGTGISDSGVAFPIPLASGGTSANLTASNGGIFYSTASAGAILAGTATANKILLSGASGAPSWSTATYPSAAGTNGNVLTSDGTNWVSSAPVAGGVTSVSGTANRITSTGGNTPVIDIAATYVGQTSLTTLGTITTGTWNASIIPLAYGGTNANLTASNGGVFYSTGSAGAILSGTATANQILLSGASGAPSWSTATYPATTTVNQLLYSSSANTIAGLSTANNGVLTTNASGVPAITALSSNGGLIIGSASGAPAAATLTAGSGITITNAANSITIAASSSVPLTFNADSGSATPSSGVITIASGPGVTTSATGSTVTVNSVTFSDPNTNGTLGINTGVFAKASITLTLPGGTLANGTLIEVVNALSSTLVVRAGTSQLIRIGANTSTATGTATSTTQGDVLVLRYRLANTTWYATSVIGTWTLA